MSETGTTAPEPTSVQLPLAREDASRLRAGDEVRLTGPVFTARDATHVRIVDELRAGGSLPHGLAGHTLFYAGPTPALPGRPAGSVGPTTASRMDAFTPELLAAGIAGTIGKGPRSAEVRSACRAYGAVYFVAVGGAAALLGTHVASAEPIAYGELGTEALVRLELDAFPAFVGIDTTGADIYGSAVGPDPGPSEGEGA